MPGWEGQSTRGKRGEPGKPSKDVCSLLDGAIVITLPGIPDSPPYYQVSSNYCVLY